MSDIYSLDDLPPEAKTLLDEADKDIIVIRDKVERQADEIRLKAESAVAKLQSEAEERVVTRQRRLLEALKPMQDRYAKEGRLDEALAIRERVRALKAGVMQAAPDPGTTAALDATPGTTLLFEVTGSRYGSVWGSDIYTGDSTLAMAAVHAGVLVEGQRGVVRVTMVDTLNVAFAGSLRNGVESMSYGPFPTGYRVERMTWSNPPGHD